MKKECCYYCGRPATSAEHVPPRCIFPEGKDAFGADMRKNLITVPSCDEHNLEKSKDDEFLMGCVTPVVGNNGAGYIQTQTKLRRAFEHSGGRLLGAVMPDAKEATWVRPDGARFPILVGQADVQRLCRAFEHVARGLYFHLRQSRFVGRCRVIPSFVRFPDDRELVVIQELARVMLRQERSNWICHGQNLDVFRFQFGPTDQYGLLPMVMTFFGGAEVFVSFQPDGVELPFRTLDEATPENPIKIEIQLGDGS